jgi:hypothetical protein
MRTHRRAGDNKGDPDKISSNGYFCAHVTIQQSGNALRVLHAGSHNLPKGSVVICPSKRDRLGLYRLENKDLSDCLNKVNPSDPEGLRGETQAQAAAQKACIDKHAH